MNIILLSDVEKVGLRGEVVTVADGYARNFLLPRRLAERATPAKVAEMRRREDRRALQEARTHEQGQKIAELLGKTVLRFEVKSGPTGSLFGSVTPTDIADEIWRTRKVRVDRRKIDLRDPIKRIGRYEVSIEVFQDVTVDVKTLVVPEGGELPPEEELEAMAAAEAAAAAPPPEDASPSIEELLEEELSVETEEIVESEPTVEPEAVVQAETVESEQTIESGQATEGENAAEPDSDTQSPS
jgi:large subunit ribosomal protein L9